MGNCESAPANNRTNNNDSNDTSCCASNNSGSDCCTGSSGSGSGSTTTRMCCSTDCLLSAHTAYTVGTHVCCADCAIIMDHARNKRLASKTQKSGETDQKKKSNYRDDDDEDDSDSGDDSKKEELGRDEIVGDVCRGEYVNTKTGSKSKCEAGATVMSNTIPPYGFTAPMCGDEAALQLWRPEQPPSNLKGSKEAFWRDVRNEMGADSAYLSKHPKGLRYCDNCARVLRRCVRCGVKLTKKSKKMSALRKRTAERDAVRNAVLSSCEKAYADGVYAPGFVEFHKATAKHKKEKK